MCPNGIEPELWKHPRFVRSVFKSEKGPSSVLWGRQVPAKQIRELAENLDISSVLSKFPYEVSGGQRQRCACARAVIVEPDIILADEPTGALDSVAARQLLNIFMMLCREYGVTILMVTHDVLSASYCDRILFMRDGEIRTSLERGQSDRSSFFAGILEKTASLENEIEKERPHARRNEGKKHVF